jgi:hypothetical protein
MIRLAVGPPQFSWPGSPAEDFTMTGYGYSTEHDVERYVRDGC